MKHPQETETDYPYAAHNNKCKYDKSKGKVKTSKVHWVKTKSVEQLKAAVANGVVSVSIQANQDPFYHYTGGIIDTPDCGVHHDHAVNVVGYGKEGDVEYYIVRNSWGPDWGEEGYARIAAREGMGICGIQYK